MKIQTKENRIENIDKMLKSNVIFFEGKRVTNFVDHSTEDDRAGIIISLFYKNNDGYLKVEHLTEKELNDSFKNGSLNLKKNITFEDVLACKADFYNNHKIVSVNDFRHCSELKNEIYIFWETLIKTKEGTKSTVYSEKFNEEEIKELIKTKSIV